MVVMPVILPHAMTSMFNKQVLEQEKLHAQIVCLFAVFHPLCMPSALILHHKASVIGCLTLAAPVGLSPLHILTLCGPERVLVVSTEPLDDLPCLATRGSVFPDVEMGCCPCR